jgi:hypothetical protein
MANEGVHECHATKDLKAEDSRNLFYQYYPGILLKAERDKSGNLSQKSRLQTNAT